MTTTEHMTGAELQTLREASGLSRETLADLAGVEPRTVKHWETRKGASVPADVADIVQQSAAWVLAVSREALRELMQSPRKPEEVVLLRYRETMHLPESARAQGLRVDTHGAIVGRLVLDLMADGIRSRVVWFDPEAYAEWLYRSFAAESRHRVTIDDTPEARNTWAAHAIRGQAIPHPTDQPPQAHTPGR